MRCYAALGHVHACVENTGGACLFIACFIPRHVHCRQPFPHPICSTSTHTVQHQRKKEKKHRKPGSVLSCHCMCREHGACLFIACFIPRHNPNPVPTPSLCMFFFFYPWSAGVATPYTKDKPHNKPGSDLLCHRMCREYRGMSIYSLLYS